MSVEITEAFVEQFSANVYELSQQKASRLLPAVFVERVTGKRAAFDRIGATAARKRTTRHADTPLMDTPHSRRWANLAFYDWADLIDNEDKVRTLIDPTNSYVQAGGYAMGRAIDDVIIEAAFGDAVTGEDADGTASFPAGQQIAHDFGDSGDSTGLSITKLRRAKKILDENEVDPSFRRYIACTAEQIEGLLGDDKVTSADYNTVKALVNGDVDSFMGFDFIRLERLQTDSNGHRRVIAWAEPALGLGMGMNPDARVSERDDKGYATQVYYAMGLGAVRIEDEAVVEIKCEEPASTVA